MQTEIEYIPAEAQPALLELTRRALESGVRERSELDEAFVKKTRAAHPRLAAPAGVFVTIYVHGELRGCLGRLQPSEPLAEVTAKLAARVVHEDTRFPPVRMDELAVMSFKISVLTPQVRVEALEEIEVGRHGLIVQKGRHRGVLLPEVPVEWGWDRPAFLVHLWRKAGLSPNVPWTETELYRFQSQIIEPGG